MFLTGLTHRRQLFNVAKRWLVDRPRPGDGRAVTELFIYDGLLSIPPARQFMTQMYTDVFEGPPVWEGIRYKHELRERALEAIGEPTPRQYEMMECYHANPEAFFRRMPIDGAMVFAPDGRMIGGIRIKRPRRVAEKASRRLAGYLGDLIRTRAEELASIRARRLGLEIGDLPADPEAEQREFIEAETWLSDQFRHGTIRIPTDAVHIDDVLGFKVIGSPTELQRAEQFIHRSRGVDLVEREEHVGAYKAVNLLLDLALPSEESIIKQYRGIDWSFAGRRGLEPEELGSRFPTFVRGAARRVRIELILTTFDEFLESELGRCIHEFRILAQREARDYRGRMAKNAEFIIEYLLTAAFSPTTHIEEIPIKMWGQYLPETLSYATRRLDGNDNVRLVIDCPDLP